MVPEQVAPIAVPCSPCHLDRITSADAFRIVDVVVRCSERLQVS